MNLKITSTMERKKISHIFDLKANLNHLGLSLA